MFLDIVVWRRACFLLRYMHTSCYPSCTLFPRRQDGKIALPRPLRGGKDGFQCLIQFFSSTLQWLIWLNDQWILTFVAVSRVSHMGVVGIYFWNLMLRTSTVRPFACSALFRCLICGWSKRVRWMYYQWFWCGAISWWRPFTDEQWRWVVVAHRIVLTNDGNIFHRYGSTESK